MRNQTKRWQQVTQLQGWGQGQMLGQMHQMKSQMGTNSHCKGGLESKGMGPLTLLKRSNAPMDRRKYDDGEGRNSRERNNLAKDRLPH